MAANVGVPATAVKDVTATGEYLTLYDDIETTELRGANIKSLNDPNTNWQQEFTNKVNDGAQFLATAFTWEEYNELVNKNVGTVPTTIVGGDVREFSHIFFNNTIHDAWCSLAYHLSELHTATENPTKWILMLVPISTSTTGSLHMQSKANTFNRAGCNQVLQLFGKLQLTNNELVNTMILECNTSVYKPLEVYTWTNNYVWSFQLPINLEYLNTEDVSLTWAFKQSFQYGGLTMLANMKPDQCLNMVKYADNNCITLNTGVKDEDRLRGSNNLVKYILANNKEVIQQQRTKREEIETARLASLSETTKEEETVTEENMERPANRQRLV